MGVKSLIAMICVALSLFDSKVHGQSLRTVTDALRTPEFVPGLSSFSVNTIINGAPTVPNPIDLLVDPVVALKNSLLGVTKTTKTTTVVPPVVGPIGGCSGNIKVKFGTTASSSETEGRLVPLKKLILLNPELSTLCTNSSKTQCKWGYIFPSGVVSGVQAEKAEYAVMIYIMSTNTWALVRAHAGEGIVEYSACRDSNKSSPDQCTTVPWLTGPAAVFTSGQTVQGVTCAV